MADYQYLTDTQLVVASQGGDQEACQALFLRYERLVYTIPLRYGLSPAEADDVFQFVWLLLLEHLPQLRDPGRVGGWLVTTARRECWNRRRGAEYRRTESVEPEQIPEERWLEEATPEEVVARYRRDQALQEALRQLEPRCRELLQLLYYDPTTPSYADIARRLHISIGAIGPTRARCLEKVRRLLQKSMYQE
ncbi:MAG: sigma-70 family RNA polymerase sigma factor [Chloroflexi bacterium]|nr:sigma-70 family RNA polymerase sigma factor [Chloroflexota bacterium]MCI0579718.1 sigma-70 family RNA polymerase sigma factor [Chloroflexota bacterium]MCI0643751.1 sigma-70 family RNA polymerase sigma factor [Chloroflexota bacterium]MCI0728448.1 sigma-70 family RNA polymerase sigma factor [Chloroflexota bacterium]